MELYSVLTINHNHVLTHAIVSYIYCISDRLLNVNIKTYLFQRAQTFIFLNLAQSAKVCSVFEEVRNSIACHIQTYILSLWAEPYLNHETYRYFLNAAIHFTDPMRMVSCFRLVCTSMHKHCPPSSCTDMHTRVKIRAGALPNHARPLHEMHSTRSSRHTKSLHAA